MEICFKKRPVWALVIVNVLAIFFITLAAEILLRIFWPSQISTIGHTASQNAKRYGWGFNPGELVRICDPDTGEIYSDRCNNHGWRDTFREYENRNSAYRILVLGDSVTLGAAVPGEKIYTRLLENQLKKACYHTEVISMGYGRWGTDQEAEALEIEGLSYKPNMIIIQFTWNDLSDNNYFHYAMKGTPILGDDMKGAKPFYYAITDDNKLVREINPFFGSGQGSEFSLFRPQDLARMLVSHSEMLKRLYERSAYYKRCQDVVSRYTIEKIKARQLQVILGLDEQSSLYRFVKEHAGEKFNRQQLDSHLRSESDRTKEIVFRVLEDRWFNNDFWLEEKYFPAKADKDSYEWRLYFGLIRKIKALAETINADVVVFNETEEGAYQWDRSWYRVSGDDESKTNFLSHMEIMKETLPGLGVQFVPNTLVYQRPRNDAHPNIQGNEAMAKDIFHFLTTHYQRKLEPYRKNDPGACPQASP